MLCPRGEFCSSLCCRLFPVPARDCWYSSLWFQPWAGCCAACWQDSQLGGFPRGGQPWCLPSGLCWHKLLWGALRRRCCNGPRHAPPCGMPHFYLFIFSFQESGACPPLVRNLSLAGFGCAWVHVRLRGRTADCPASTLLTA